MKAENFNKEERYVAPELETVLIIPRTAVLGNSPMEGIDPSNPDCPMEELCVDG